jgi:MYXO-CTERM domain-containing protein
MRTWAVIVWLASALGSARADATWKRFESADGRFRADFPGSPEATHEPVDVPNLGRLVMHQFTVEVTAELVYGVMYDDLPSEPPNPQAVLDGARDGMLRQTAATLISETSIAIDGYPGREVRSRLRGGFEARARIYVVKARQYMLLVVDTRKPAAQPTRFFDSFKLVGTPAQTAQDPELVEADRLGARAKQLHVDHRDREAIPLAERVLAIRARLLGPEHRDTALAASDLGTITYSAGDSARAKQLWERALPVMEKTLGPDNPTVLAIRYFLALVYYNDGELAKAEPLFLKALEHAERTHDDLKTAEVLAQLAALYVHSGDTSRAEPLVLRSLAIREQKLGKNDVAVSDSLLVLGNLYKQRGDYARAEPVQQRVLAIREAAGDDDGIATAANNLGLLYAAVGDYDRALPLLERALAITERAARAAPAGTSSATIAASMLSKALNNLATLYRHRNELLKAELLLDRAVQLAIDGGADSPEAATALANLAEVRAERGATAEAEELYARALAIDEKVFGPDNPELATPLNGLAVLHQSRGDYARAEREYARAAAIFANTFGPEHPDAVHGVMNQAWLLAARGDFARAIALVTRADDLRERALDVILASGAEAQKHAYLATLQGETDVSISLHVRSAPQLDDGARLALTTILRRKGRVLDASTDTLSVLRRSADGPTRAQLDELAATNAELAALVFRGPEQGTTVAAREARIAKLRDTAHHLEADLARRYAALRGVHEPVTIDRVQAALGDAVLVELALFSPFDPRAAKLTERWGAKTYVAYVLQPTGAPRAVELGPAAPIDALVRKTRAALATPNGTDARALLRELDERVMRRIRPLLGDRRDVLISADGMLNLVTFDAMIDERGRYLVESYQFTYLTSGRDLLRAKDGTTRGHDLVMANPSFGEASDRAAAIVRGAFVPLPGTEAEARAIDQLLDHPSVLIGGDATEAALKAASGPRIVHLATHGFFLDDLPDAGPHTRGFSVGARSRDDLPPPQQPLLRSGLALAGANSGELGGDDGILTALEAASLDLHGTRLVVLSACDTAVGDVVDGDGVYGLRRAFVLAGAETTVMSLWKVDDNATKDLMVAYYRELRAGRGRAEAMRRVQLAMLHAPATAHPYFWAAFVVSGDRAALDGKPIGPPAVAPRARGCACRAGTASPSTLALALAILVALRRRRRFAMF